MIISIDYQCKKPTYNWYPSYQIPQNIYILNSSSLLYILILWSYKLNHPSSKCLWTLVHDNFKSIWKTQWNNLSHCFIFSSGLHNILPSFALKRGLYFFSQRSSELSVHFFAYSSANKLENTHTQYQNQQQKNNKTLIPAVITVLYMLSIEYV